MNPYPAIVLKWGHTEMSELFTLSWLYILGEILQKIKYLSKENSSVLDYSRFI